MVLSSGERSWWPSPPATDNPEAGRPPKRPPVSVEQALTELVGPLGALQHGKAHGPATRDTPHSDRR